MNALNLFSRNIFKTFVCKEHKVNQDLVEGCHGIKEEVIFFFRFEKLVHLNKQEVRG